MGRARYDTVLGVGDIHNYGRHAMVNGTASIYLLKVHVSRGNTQGRLTRTKPV